MNADERDEITAAVSASGELGPRYDSAIAESLVERIGDEIDRRVESRLRGQRPGPPAAAPQTPPPLARKASGDPPAGRGKADAVTGMILGLGSIGLAVGATGAVVSHRAAPVAQVFMILLIWAAIAVVNIANSRRR